MTWLAWRLQRTETLILAAVLALLCVLLIPTGIQMASAYHHDGLAACAVGNPSQACGNVVQNFTARFEGIRNATVWLTLFPGLIGVSLAAPLVLDLEHGTHRLAWTQSITRRRWLAGKVGMAVAVALLVTLGLTLLLTWWRIPFVNLNGRVGTPEYDAEGIVPYAYTLFALGLAMAIGVVWRRAAAAIVVAFLGYFGLRLFVDIWLRQRLISPVSTTWNAASNGPDLNHAWVLSQSPSDSVGNNIPVNPGICAPAAAQGDPNCLPQHGAGFTHAVYHPPSHFWPLQSIETAIFAGAGLLLIAFAAWWAHERTA